MIKGQPSGMQLVISKEVYWIVRGENTVCSSSKGKIEMSIVEGGNHREV